MKKLNLFIVIFEVTFFSLMVFLLFQMHLLDTTLYTSSQNKTKMLKVADELRQSSDDLTHFARTYAITNNRLYLQQYIDTLDIRNGKTARPFMYDSVYWDLKKNIRIKRHPATKTISLKEMIKELPFSTKEMNKLHFSEESSNDLVNLEMIAFEAMSSNTPNQQYAIKLLHSKDYYNAKHKIMNPIDEFIIMLNERLKNEFNETEEKVQNNFILFLVILFIFIIGNIILYKLMQKSLLKIIELEVEKNRKKDQQMLEQSRLAQMGEMISMIAHQWRQPLNIISVRADNIIADIELNNLDENSLRDQTEGIAATTKELSKTIDDFREFHISNKQLVIIKLEDVIEQSLKIIKPSLVNNNINIIQEYNSDKEIELYDNEIMQVVFNILKNAQESFKEKQIKNPKITIKTENRTISICNNGEEIPENIIDKIFDPYFSTKDEKNGTGLGLYMSNTIIEDHHNGKLSVENIDDGVCFTIELGIISEK